MKCPKCGYISFDYNQVCPKCNKNISLEQEKFNLPSFRPDPPSLLGFLTGEANESNVNLRVPSGSRIDRVSEEEIGLNDSVVLDHDQIGIDEQDLDISFEPEESEEDLFGQESAAEPEIKISDADFRLEGTGMKEASLPPEHGEEEEISLDLGDLSLEEPGELLGKLEDSGLEKPISEDDSEISIDSLDSLAVDIDGGLDEIESEIELDLDDLKVSEMGNLEIGPDAEISGMEMEKTIVDSEADTLHPEIELSDEEEDKLPDISALILEGEGHEEKTMILDDFSLDDLGTAEKAEALELGDMPLEDLDLGIEESLDLEDLNLDEKSPDDREKTILLEDLELNDSSELEKSFDISDISIDEDFNENKTGPSQEAMSDSAELDIDLDAMSLDIDEYQKASNSSDEFELDLDDMDIDLDIDEPKNK